jgi:hypothetical protein
MLLRNYDNLFILKNAPFIYLPNTFDLGQDSVFSDGHLGLRSTSNIDFSYHEVYATAYQGKDPPLSGFTLGGNYYEASTDKHNNLICGAGNKKVNYDDHELNDLINSNDLQAVSHSIEPFVYDARTKTYSRTYKKVFLAKKDLIIKEVGITKTVTFNTSQRMYPVLLYREVISEDGIEVPENGTVVINFTMVFTANINKPVEVNVDLNVN